MLRRRKCNHELLGHAVALGLIFAASAATAQAWVPPRGEGTLALGYTYFNGGDHVYPDDSIDGLTTLGYTAEGNRWYLGQETNQAITGTFDFGLPWRLALSGGITWIATRYEGRAQWNFDTDHGDWNHTWQDSFAQLRWNMFMDPVVVTPFIAWGFPVTEYATIGHAAPGRHVQSGTVGVFAGRNLSGWIPRTWIEADYRFTFEEENQGFNLNRHEVAGSVGHQLLSFLDLSTGLSYATTSGGLPWTGPESVHEGGDPNSGQLDASISNIERLRWMVSAGAFVYGTWRLQAAFVSIVYASNTIDGNFFSTSISTSFRTPWARKSRWH